MSIRIDNLENPQEMEVVVSGPDGANRLFLISGIVPIFFSSAAVGVVQRETFTFLVGPVLTRRQFVRATGSAAIVRVTTSTPATGAAQLWSLVSADLDRDDESGRVEFRVELRVELPAQIQGGVGSSVQIAGVSYSGAILAEVGGA